ncbi:hypothetical protein D1007_52271 [Hordeum vulgare]|nr:hypothetical protein D1007_52271 [Hordeum vulgare]
MEDDDKMDKFGNHLLLLRDSTASLDEARIVVRTVASTTCTVWIRHVIMHKVRHLHVSGSGHLDSSAMPPSHHLKTIRLHFVILGHGLFRPLNYDCRVLQLLQLEDCVLVGLKEISSRSLKRGLWICPMFSNLTSLLLGHCCMAADFDALLQILQRSPKLKEFTFNLKREAENCGFVEWVDPKWPPTMQNALLKLWDIYGDNTSDRRMDNLESSLTIHHLREEKNKLEANYDKLVEDVHQLFNAQEDMMMDFSYLQSKMKDAEVTNSVIYDIKIEMEKKDAEILKLQEKYKVSQAQGTIIQNLKLNHLKEKQQLSEASRNL